MTEVSYKDLIRQAFPQKEPWSAAARSSVDALELKFQKDTLCNKIDAICVWLDCIAEDNPKHDWSVVALLNLISENTWPEGSVGALARVVHGSLADWRINPREQRFVTIADIQFVAAMLAEEVHKSSG